MNQIKFTSSSFALNTSLHAWLAPLVIEDITEAMLASKIHDQIQRQLSLYLLNLMFIVLHTAGLLEKFGVWTICIKSLKVHFRIKSVYKIIALNQPIFFKIRFDIQHIRKNFDFYIKTKNTKNC